MRSFDAVTADNDPLGKHNFGSFNVDDKKFNFKIDYYALDMLRGSEDPSDPDKTIRVLNIFLAADF